MSFKNSLTILIALALAGIVAWMGNAWLESRLSQQQQQTVEETVPVVMAATDIPPNTPISPAQLRIENIPRVFVPQSAIAEPDNLIGRRFREPVYAGEIILKKRLLEDADYNQLASSLNPGMRAITLSLDVLNSQAGFLLPGSHVDILSLQSGQPARMVLQDVKVIAVGQHLSVEGGTVKADTVTLEVDPQQAEALLDMANTSTIRLMLRRQDDKTQIAAREGAIPVSAADKQNIATRSEPAAISVTIIRGIDELNQVMAAPALTKTPRPTTRED